eukprot:snap_masked-scaffold_2-processed-gene-12.48-mRNA-1 protein AED:1.00 eAED:1.00 QI:0/-1/0/0/-1/1/1/0/275
MNLEEREKELLELDAQLEKEKNEALREVGEICGNHESNLQAILGRNAVEMNRFGSVERQEENLIEKVLRNNEEIGSRAMLKMEKIKEKCANFENDKLRKAIKVLEDGNAAIQKELNVYRKENKDLRTKLNKTETSHQKASNAYKKIKDSEMEFNSQNKTLKDENRSLKQDLIRSQREKKSFENQLEQSKQKYILMKKQEAKKLEEAVADANILKEKVSHLGNTNKKLKESVQNLEIVVKKQMKLTSLLKKQNLHLQALKMLAFTEKEFRNVLNVP